MEKVLLGVGVVSFIGYLIWLVICAMNWDSKIPPIVGMLLSVVMILGGLSKMPLYEDIPKIIKQDENVSAQSNFNPKPENPDNETGEILSNENLKTNDDTTDSFIENYSEYESNPPIDLVSCGVRRGTLDIPEFYLKAKNTAEKIIKEFSVCVFAYDEDGIPIPIEMMGGYHSNLRYSKAVKVGEETNTQSGWSLYYGDFNSKTQFVVILKSVDFFDDTTWENNQYENLVEKYDQQLLIAEDENILPRI